MYRDMAYIYSTKKYVVIYDAFLTSKPSFLEISRLGLVTMEDLFSFIPVVVFCPPQMHLIVKAILSDVLPMEYNIIIMSTCLQLIQHNITDWTIGYEHIEYQCIAAIIGYMVHKSAITSTGYITRSVNMKIIVTIKRIMAYRQLRLEAEEHLSKLLCCGCE